MTGGSWRVVKVEAALLGSPAARGADASSLTSLMMMESPPTSSAFRFFLLHPLSATLSLARYGLPSPSEKPLSSSSSDADESSLSSPASSAFISALLQQNRISLE